MYISVYLSVSLSIYLSVYLLQKTRDEVVTLEPAFDTYPAQVQMAGGVSVYVPLELDVESRNWKLDTNKMEKAITKKTKILLLNTPHNPSGKVLTKQELEDIASILKRNPHVTAVMDEVYEKLVYDGKEHIRLASLPGMWDRCITISSSGKTFSGKLDIFLFFPLLKLTKSFKFTHLLLINMFIFYL